MKKESQKNTILALLLSAAAGTAVLYSWSFYNWIVLAYGAALALLFLTAAAGTRCSGCKKAERNGPP